MTINKIQDGTSLTIALEGRLDTTTSPELDAVLNESLPGVTELVLDFADLSYISSAGLRVLLIAQKTMATQGSMKVCNVNDVIMEIFELTGFSGIITIE